MCLAASGIAQETRIVDSLQDVLRNQEGREKVLTMIELTWEFYDISFDDCIDWGEKAIKEAQNQGLADLEAKANYVTGLQFAYHGDLDLAKDYLYKSYNQYVALSDNENAFESLWDIATFELTLGNIDTAYNVYQEALGIAEDDYYSGCAGIFANLGYIESLRKHLLLAYDYYEKAKRNYRYLDDEKMVYRMDWEIANILMGLGKSEEARRLYWKVLPRLEKYEEYYPSSAVCNGLGKLYVETFVDYDSAWYYFQKALEFSEMPMRSKESEILADNTRIDVMVEIAALLMRRDDYNNAIKQYHYAIELAKEQNYQYGQMEACAGLMVLYSQMGQAAKSLQYYERYVEMEKSSGIAVIRPLISKHLAMDYAHLGRFDDLESELDGFEEEHAALIRENADLQEQNQILMDEASELLQNYETQGRELKSCQTSMLRYRLAFYGILTLLLLVLLSVAYWALRRKKSAKKEDKIEKG